MKAAVFKGPGKPLAIETVDDPTPAAGQLVLRVAGCGICGSDLHMSEQPLPAGMVMGHEFAGEVAEVGPALGRASSPLADTAAAQQWKVGDRVCALPVFGCGHCRECLAGHAVHCRAQRGTGLGRVPGAYAEYVLADAGETFCLPENLASHEGALVEPLAVGLHVVNAAALRAGDDVLIIGAGPVGLATPLWARHVGAREIVVSDFVPERRAMAERFGASAVIDPGAGEIAADFERIAGRPPSVVIECVGVPGIIQECFRLAPPRSRVVVAGVCLEPDTIVPVHAVLKELTVRFVSFYERGDFGYTLDMIAAERIAPKGMITHLIGLDELPEAFEALRTPTTQCKVVVRP